MLSGFICVYHSSALGLSPKHTIFALIFIVFVLPLSYEKHENEQKRGWAWPIFLKNTIYSKKK